MSGSQVGSYFAPSPTCPCQDIWCQILQRQEKHFTLDQIFAQSKVSSADIVFARCHTKAPVCAIRRISFSCILSKRSSFMWKCNQHKSRRPKISLYINQSLSS